MTLRIDAFYEFVRKRENIRLAKLEGKPWPWTNDPILRAYKFTNVKREHDKTSVEMRKVYSKYRHAPRKEILLNAAIARYFGRHEFFSSLGWQPHLHEEKLLKEVRWRQESKLPVWTGAYMITNNGISAPKEEVVVRHFLRGLWSRIDHLIKMAEDRWSWQDLIYAMRGIDGFGGTGFMSKEVVLDTMYTDFWPEERGTLRVPSDWDTWCPAGPGARRGACRVLGLPKDAKMDEEKALATMLELWSARDKNWPSEWAPLDLHDVQFQLCEFDKYERTLNDEGRPRSLYRAPH